MTNAAIYVRISQDRTGEHLGVDRQREDCEEHAKSLGWDVAEVYIDNDKSAYKRRPAYETMLVDIDAGKIDAIVAWHPDRLYRVVKDLGELVDVCKRNETQISTVRAGTIDLSTPAGRFMAGQLALMATYEGEAKSDRWKRAWKQARTAGRWFNSGTRLFGYTRDGEVIPEEADIARQIAARINDDEPILGVARWLQDQGIKGTRGSDWTPAAIKSYLLTPTIAGWASLDGQVVAEGDWEPVVDREAWEGVRAMLTARTRPPLAKVSSLTRLLECGLCGTKMVTSGYTRKGVSYRTYRCVSRPGIGGCGKVSGSAPEIEETVYAYTRARLKDPRVRKRIADLRAEPTNAQTELMNLELRVSELEAELDEPDVPVRAITDAIRRTKAKQQELLDALASRNLEPLPVGDEWPEDLRRRRALVDLVVKSVVLNPATRPSRYGFDVERVQIVGR